MRPTRNKYIRETKTTNNKKNRLKKQTKEIILLPCNI